MVVVCESVEDITKRINREHKEIELEKIIILDFPFLTNEKKFTLISLPSYGEQKNNIIYVSKGIFVLSIAKIPPFNNNFKKIINKKYSKSTITILSVLKAVLKNYSYEFERIREIMNRLEIAPRIEIIEEKGRELRKITDRIEGLLQMIIELKERDILAFNTSIIPFEYELLNTEARYLLERCRSHVYRIASLRTKSEMQSNRELNNTMKKLTVIMTFLSIVGIVVNVPGTVGAIFGIPALSDAYFKTHTDFLLITLIITTALSIILGYAYWRSLRLKS